LQEGVSTLEADDAHAGYFLASQVEKDDAGRPEQVEPPQQRLVVVIVGGDINLQQRLADTLLHARVGQLFDALVTGSTDRGAWVRTFDPPVEGRLSGDLPDLDVGQVVRVRLVSTSVERGFIDFELAH